MRDKSITKQIKRQTIKDVHRRQSNNYKANVSQNRQLLSDIKVELNPNGLHQKRAKPSRNAMQIAELENRIISMEDIMIALKDKLLAIERDIY